MKSLIAFILEIPLKKRITRLTDLFISKPELELHYEDLDYEFIAWGDPIDDNDIKEGLKKNNSPEFIVNNLYGHYYFVYLDKQSGELIAGNSLFSILPMYYYCNNEKITISGNALTLGSYLGLDNINKQFILEVILFNYPIFNNSICKDVHLLPSNSSFDISGDKFSLRKHTETANFFENNPIPLKEAVRTIPDRFLETVEKYLSSGHYTSALTGGFDGRTLVATGLFHNKDFSTYSFGIETSKDVLIAESLSADAGVHFNKILLGEEYVRQESLECGKEFILNSSGTATFARAHYLYAAQKLSADNDYIVTGNFGSEILRAAHNIGPVISENLFSFFNAYFPDEAFKSIETSEEFKFLTLNSFKEEWDSLKEDLLKMPNFNQDYSGFTKNQRFYVFVFEELFRKYYGAEMVNQFYYIKNRTPFLDIDFLKEFWKTELAGLYSNFFENNPMKRYKGQVLYAHIISKAYPPFGKVITDKGYRPDNLIDFFGKFNILKNYLKKRIQKAPSDPDPNSVSRAWEANREYWTYLPVSGEFFDFNKAGDKISKEILFKIQSISYVKKLLSLRYEGLNNFL